MHGLFRCPLNQVHVHTGLEIAFVCAMQLTL